MKLLKFSLATIIAMGTVAFASDNLADAFKNGSLKGELKSYYYNRDKGNGAIKGDIITLGAKLDYETDAFYAFKAGFGVQTSNSPWADEEGKSAYGTTPGGGLQDMWGSGAVLSQAYLAYSMSNTTLKVGRQYIDMPLLGSAPSRLIVESFEGATLVNKDIPNTTIMAAYINKYQGWTDGAGKIANFEKFAHPSTKEQIDYGYTIAVVNKSFSGTTLTAAYGKLDNAFSMLYADAKYDGEMGSFAYNAALQYGDVDYDTESGPFTDSNYYGIKFGANIGAFSTYAAYVNIEDGMAWWGVSGHGTKPMIFTTADVEAGVYDESKQYAVDAKYFFSSIGVLVGVRHVNVDYTNSSDEADFNLIYGGTKFGGALKGLGIGAVYEDENHENNAKDKKELWVRINYEF